MRVDVSGNSFQFPAECACCGRPSNVSLGLALTKTSGKKVVHSRTTAWDIPYCAPCAAHIAAMDRARTMATVLVATLGLLALFSLCGGYAGLGVFLLIVGLVAAAVIHNRLSAAARAMCSPECACADRSVRYLYWHGTHHAFDMASPRFALAFMRANVKKLINLDGPTTQWLAANGVALSAPGQQSARRYRT